MFALDTNSVIYFFKGMGRVAERLLATPPAEVGIPTVVVYELQVGLLKARRPKRRQRQLDEFLRWVKVIPFDTDEARESAELRVLLERAGTPIGPMDVLIAGTVKANGATLVTHNTTEFRRVKGLAIEDWF